MDVSSVAAASVAARSAETKGSLVAKFARDNAAADAAIADVLEAAAQRLARTSSGQHVDRTA
jgi:hypothetical protein